MNCPICQAECQERPNTATYFYKGEAYKYDYRQYACYRHHPYRWQSEKQMQDALDEIEKIKRRVDKLEKERA